MQDRDLDKIFQMWVDDESASVPKLRPTAEMYERVASLVQRRSLGLLFARRPAWATALAVVVILVLAFSVVQFSPLVGPGGGQQVARVPQRAAFAAEKGHPKMAPPVVYFSHHFDLLGHSEVPALDLGGIVIPDL